MRHDDRAFDLASSNCGNAGSNFTSVIGDWSMSVGDTFDDDRHADERAGLHVGNEHLPDLRMEAEIGRGVNFGPYFTAGPLPPRSS